MLRNLRNIKYTRKKSFIKSTVDCLALLKIGLFGFRQEMMLSVLRQEN